MLCRPYIRGHAGYREKIKLEVYTMGFCLRIFWYTEAVKSWEKSELSARARNAPVSMKTFI